MSINDFAVIGKGFLTSLVGVQANSKVVYTERYADLSICMLKRDCPIVETISNKKTLKPILSKRARSICHIRKSTKSLRSCTLPLVTRLQLTHLAMRKTLNAYCGAKLSNPKSLCSNCPHGAVNSVERVVYTNESHYYNLPKEQKGVRLSKTQIKLGLLYHFLLDNSRGIIPRVNIVEVAKEMGCDVKTIHAAHEVLNKYNYLHICRIDSTHVSVYVPERKNYALPREKGGTGYITMPKNLLQELFALSNVNELRAAIRIMIKEDTANIKKEVEEVDQAQGQPTRKAARFKLIEMLPFFPKYMRHKKSTNTILDSLKELFHVNTDETKMEFSLKDKFIGKALRQNHVEDYLELVTELATRFTMPIPRKDLHSIANMCIQYGNYYVERAFSLVSATFTRQAKAFREGKITNPITPESIQSYGRYFRTTIEDIIRKAVLS